MDSVQDTFDEEEEEDDSMEVEDEFHNSVSTIWPNMYTAEVGKKIFSKQFLTISLQKKHRPSAYYMRDVQTDITPSMRSILVDWLNEVTQEYELTNETLYLAVNLTDRFLSKVPASRGKLQLIGITCVLLAS